MGPAINGCAIARSRDFLMKNTMLGVVAALVLAGCGGSGVPDARMLTDLDQDAVMTGGGGGNNGRPSVTDQDAAFGRMLNNVRLSDGAGVVTFNRQLNRAAQRHADDMAENNYFSHVSRDGRTVVDRIRATGYNPVAFGENIAGGQQSDAEALRAWRNSAAHDRLLKSRAVDEFGLGVAGSGNRTRWVLVMAAD